MAHYHFVLPITINVEHVYIGLVWSTRCLGTSWINQALDFRHLMKEAIVFDLGMVH
jgi:hypothetical protein